MKLGSAITLLAIQIHQSSISFVVFYLLKNLNYDGFVGGSAVPTLNRNDVHAYGIAIPPLELQKSFSQKGYEPYLLQRRKSF